MKADLDLKKMAQVAKALTFQMAAASLKQRNHALEAMIENLKKWQDPILQANLQDRATAKANGLNEALLERLSLENKLEGIIHDIKQVILLPDPLGETFDEQNLPNRLHLARYRTPIGVLGIIYESRPNVTIDISALAIKSGNCALLRGGSETLRTNQVLIEVIQNSLAIAELPSEVIQLIASPDRSQVKELLQLHESIDLIIPRGSASLQEFCRKNSTIPVITGGIGICHLFVDETADLERSLKVILNAKTQRPNVCNALDTLLVHAAIAPVFIPKVIEALSHKKVTFKLDQRAWNLYCGAMNFFEILSSEAKPDRSEAVRMRSPMAIAMGDEEDRSGEAAAEKIRKNSSPRSIAQKGPSCEPATAHDWDTEWLSLILGIKVVADLKEAIGHIHLHSTGHSDGILTENDQNAERFIKEIDSAVVYVNASTRFTDGGQFGFGSEVAISTQKLHARGPMGLKELTSYKWVVRGDYQVRI